MIIFYDKKSGEIRGTIGGRINNPEELEMFVGDPKDNDKMVVEWEPTEFIQDEKDPSKKTATKFEANHPQRKLFETLEKDHMSIYDYTVKGGKLVAKDKK